MTHQKGCLLLPNLPLQSSSSAETKETLILPSSSSAPPFNSWCLFTALLPSLPHFYSSPLPATLPPKQPALGGPRNTTMELGWWRGSKKSRKLSCSFSQMFLTDLMWFTRYWYIIARPPPTHWSPWLNLQPAIQIAFTLPMQALPGTWSAKTTYGK